MRETVMADREREALRQAREALQTIEDEGESHFYATITCAISAIDAALSAPQHSHEAPHRSFAGWFREIPSAMSYRLWEQGGHEQTPGDVALYE
jgi:hypothetical protein